MYIWRGKNRRDKRNLLLSGEEGWGCEKGATSHSRLENEVRLENENRHVEYYHKKIRLLMEQYMTTKDGMKEILLLIDEFEKEQPSYLVFNDEKSKELLFDVYQLYCIPNTNDINKDGIQELLSNLRFTIPKKSFDAFIKKLKLHRVEVLSVDFDSFREVLYEELLSDSKNKGVGISWDMIPLIPNRKKQNTINFEQRFKEIAVKILLVEEAIHRSTEDAKNEFRKIHPSKLTCDICNQAFTIEEDLIEHKNEVEFHKNWSTMKLNNELKFKCIANIYLGDQGRRLLANRLIFSKELNSLKSRIDGAVEDPYRPNIADKHGKRYEQQLHGSYVTGYDPKSGIRPMYRQNGLIRQHLAPIRNKTITGSLFAIAHHPQLQEIVHQLLCCKDEFIDTVSTCDNTVNQAYLTNTEQNMFAFVRFEWSGFAKNQVYIIGEFTGWKPEEMICSAITNKFTIVKQLCPGKYKYRFLIEEKECVDEISSKTVDPSSKCGYSNELLVINTPLFHTQSSSSSHTTDGNILLESYSGPPDDPESVLGQSVMEFLEGKGSHTSRVHTPLKQLVKQRTLTQQGILPSPAAFDSPDKSYVSTAHSSTSTTVPTVKIGDIVHMSKTDKAAIIRSLQSIELRNMALFDDGAWVLASHISRNKFIQSIDLSYNSISDEGIQAFSSSLPLLLTLNTLKLNGNGFAFDGCRYLCDVLSSCTTLICLELSNNRIGDDGMECICKYLRYNENLLDLYVDNCLIGNDGLFCLHDALHMNRRLKRISMSGNKFGLPGITKLCKALEYNAALKDLNLSVNSLGPEACNIIGHMLVINDTIVSINLNNVDMMGALHSSFGIYGICQAINTNHTLKILLLKNNALKDEHILEIACSLTKNRTLLEIDLTGNPIQNNDWLHPHRTVKTLKMGLEDMPSIPKSLRKNHKYLEEIRIHGSNYDKEIKIRFVDDVSNGRWTVRREWIQVVLTKAEKLLLKKDSSEESVRMELENEFIKSNLDKTLMSLRIYLREKPCALYLQTLSKCIAQYIHDLPQFDYTKLLNPSTIPMNRKLGASTSINDIRQALVTSRKISSPTGRSTVPTSATTQMRMSTQGFDDDNISLNLPSITHTRHSDYSRGDGEQFSRETGGYTLIPQISSKTNHSMASSQNLIGNKSDFVLENFMNAHVCIINAIFNKLYRCTDQKLIKEVNPNDPYEFHSRLLLHPLLVQQAFQLLALPIPIEEVQNTVDITKVPGFNMIGLHKFSDYILHNANRLSKIHTFQRLRILADLMLHPPIDEAIEIIVDQLRYCHYIELRDQYRKIPENKVLYECSFCHKRFARQEFLDKHIAKGLWSTEHQRHRVEEVIHHSQLLFLQQVKSSLTNVLYPAYYELKPSKELPRNYFPQVFDMVGSEGRPFGVVEADRTIRVLDAFGEYLQVSLHGRIGWIHYRKGTVEYLRPLQGFDWNHLHIQEDLTYYRVNDLLPSDVELKVRYQPYETAEILGYLKRNHVIECMAVIGDWLQVRYEKEDAAWVRWVIPEYKNKRNAQVNPVSMVQESSHLDSPYNMENSSKFSMKFSRMLTTLGSNSFKSLGGFSAVTSSSSSKDRIPPPMIGGLKTVSFATTGESTTKTVTAMAGSPSRAGLHTPGEKLEEHDELFLDHILTYEINNKKMKVNTRKNPNISRKKLDLFNTIRYGSSKTNTKHANLLKLPKMCLSIFIPKVSAAFNEEKNIIPTSPIIIDQKMLFNHIISLSDFDLTSEDMMIQTPEMERNRLFFFQNNNNNNNSNMYHTSYRSSNRNFQTLLHDNKIDYNHNDNLINHQEDENSSTMGGFSKQGDSLHCYDFIKK